MSYEYEFKSVEETMQFAVQLGRRCVGGELFLLASDLGGGKTTFTKGLAQGLDVTDTVSSPTFMISRVYSGRNDIELHHYDFYRLPEAGLMAHELQDVLGDKRAVIVIEWGDIVGDALPVDKVSIVIKRKAEHEDWRTLLIELPDSLNYLMSHEEQK